MPRGLLHVIPTRLQVARTVPRRSASCNCPRAGRTSSCMATWHWWPPARTLCSSISRTPLIPLSLAKLTAPSVTGLPSPMTAIPLGNLKPGIQTVTIPTGLHMSSSSQLVTVFLNKPDGSQTPPEQLPLYSPSFVPPSSTNSTGSGSSSGSGQSGSGSSSGSGPSGASSLPAPFDSISPSSIQMGSGDTVVTVFGSSAGSLSQIVVRGLDSQWNPINVTSASGTVAQFTLPGALLSQSGFLEVAPIQDDGTSIPLMVYDPTLPAVGTGANLQGLFIDNDNEGTITPILITLGGANFTNGMTIVLGRGTTPGVALPTTFVDSNALQAQIPVPFAGEADDLFAAVRSAEGTLLSPTVPYPRPTLVHVATSAFPGEPDLTVNTISPGIDPAEAASVTLFGPTETGITSINGNMVETIGLASNHPQQFLTISGANLADGMQVDFSTMKGGQVLHRTAPLTGTHVVASLISSNDLPPISTTSLMRSKVAVPQDIVDTKLKGIQIKSDKAKSNSGVVNADPPTVV